MYYLEDCTEGRIWSGGSYLLTEHEIVAFAREWDPQSFHIDAEAARCSVHGGLIASSVHLYGIMAKLLCGLGRFAGIGSLKHEMRIVNPGRPGDTLTLAFKCLSSRQSRTKPDRGLLEALITLENQRGEVVLSTTSTMMLHTRPAS